MADLVLVERRADGVAVLTLNNPKVNALSRRSCWLNCMLRQPT